MIREVLAWTAQAQLVWTPRYDSVVVEFRRSISLEAPLFSAVEHKVALRSGAGSSLANFLAICVTVSTRFSCTYYVIKHLNVLNKLKKSKLQLANRGILWTRYSPAGRTFT